MGVLQFGRLIPTSLPEGDGLLLEIKWAFVIEVFAKLMGKFLNVCRREQLARVLGRHEGRLSTPQCQLRPGQSRVLRCTR